MSLFRQRSLDAAELVAERASRRSHPAVTRDSSLRHSAVWACRRLRADMVSMMPVNTYREIDGVDVAAFKRPVFITPGGDDVLWGEWAYSTTDDLDSVGNTVGVITQRTQGLPSRIELVPDHLVSAKGKGSRIVEWRINGERHEPEQIWHERQYTRSGLPLGLSPIAYAAMSIGGYLSAQEFARDWFSGGGIPSARLRNTKKTVTPKEAAEVKQRFRTTVGTGDLFVTGNDWEYDTIQAKASESSFIEQMQFSITDICRFLGVPADMVDAETSAGSITYANVTQRNLQFLILNLNPLLQRREEAFSYRLVPRPQKVKFNRAVLLEMDLKSRYEAHKIAIDSEWLAPSEVRTIEDRPPFTDEQKAEIAARRKAPTQPGVPK